MKLSKATLPFIGIIFLSLIVVLLSIWDIIYNEQWLERIVALYGILFILTLLFFFFQTKNKPMVKKTVEEFEKSLEGKLHHFKCPRCNGIFAIKKSKHNNKKAFSLTCPDCGIRGMITSKPSLVVEEIPEKKSLHKNFTCGTCGEWIMVWAEGADLISDIHVYSCPYCGTKKDMRLTQ